MECILCKIQYVETSHFRLKNHKKDVNNLKAIRLCHHFKMHGQNFVKHAEFTLIEKISETSTVIKDNLVLRLKW